MPRDPNSWLRDEHQFERWRRQSERWPQLTAAQRLLLFGGGKKAAFSPTQIAGLQLWLKADAGAFHDAGTTLATNGQTVQQWNDQSGNGNNVSQATAGNRPTWNTGQQNGLPGITVANATAQALAATFTLNQPEDVFVVMKVGSFAGNNTFIDGTTINHMRLADFGTNQITMFAGSGGPSVTPGTTSFHIIEALFSGASSYIQMDNNSKVTGNPGANNAGGLNIGAIASDADAAIFGEILIYSSALSAGNITLVRNYLNARWAIF